MEQALTICEQCDAVYRRPALARGARARCARCGAALFASRRSSPQTLIALATAGVVVFLIANAYPIVAIELGGEHTQTTLLGAIAHTSVNGLLPLSAVAAISLFIFPLLQILGTLYVLLPLERGVRPKYFVIAMHALQRLRPWSMVEVFLLGSLVALVKLSATSTVIPGIGLWAFAALTLILTALSSFDLHEIWDRAWALKA